MKWQGFRMGRVKKGGVGSERLEKMRQKYNCGKGGGREKGKKKGKRGTTLEVKGLGRDTPRGRGRRGEGLFPISKKGSHKGKGFVDRRKIQNGPIYEG